MRQKHVAFILESADGHINPTLGITLGLVRHGYRVSYAIREEFAPRVSAHGGTALIYSPLDYRDEFTPRERRLEESSCSKERERFVRELWADFVRNEVANSLLQLEMLYRDDPPDLIIYDCRNLAGRSLALKWGIPKIEHSPMTIGGDDKSFLNHSYDEDLILISVPRFFQRNAEVLDRRFRFIGPIFSDKMASETWETRNNLDRTILVSGPTAGLPSIDRFKLAIRAFSGLHCRVILSVGEKMDRCLFGDLPENISVNQISSHLDMLREARLFVGHGGQTSTLEALYRGVPLLIFPVTEGSIYASVALRVVELGLGVSIKGEDVSAAELRDTAVAVLEDEEMFERVKNVQNTLQNGNNADEAVNLISSRV